jgi:hypothetical protein
MMTTAIDRPFIDCCSFIPLSDVIMTEKPDFSASVNSAPFFQHVPRHVESCTDFVPGKVIGEPPIEVMVEEEFHF